MRRIKKRAVLLLVTMATALVVASGAALAATITCSGAQFCKGTKRSDVITGTGSSEFIRALKGSDRITGAGGGDIIHGGGGNDTYLYQDGFEDDRVYDTSGVDTVDFSGVTGGMDIAVVPDYVNSSGSSFWNSATRRSVSIDDVVFRNVDGTNSVIEKVVGSRGQDNIYGGKANNMLDPGPHHGSFTDLLEDRGGHPGDSAAGLPALPPSDDTYRGFLRSISNNVIVQDWGGARDTVDLRPARTSDARIKFVEGDPDGFSEGIQIHIAFGSEVTSVVTVGCHYHDEGDPDCGSQDGRIERFVFANRVLGANEIGNLPLAP